MPSGLVEEREATVGRFLLHLQFLQYVHVIDVFSAKLLLLHKVDYTHQFTLYTTPCDSLRDVLSYAPVNVAC